MEYDSLIKHYLLVFDIDISTIDISVQTIVEERPLVLKITSLVRQHCQ